MSDDSAHVCPDCEDRLHYAFHDTSGVGAWKLGDGFNTTPDTAHYICFPCGRAWKQRLSGPLTPDIVGDLAFFSCRQPDCGQPLLAINESATPTDIRLQCAQGHRYAVVAGEQGGLTMEEVRSTK